MGLNSNKTSIKHAKDYSSKTEHVDSETKHQKAYTGFETELKTYETKPNIPPFPFPFKQSFYLPFK